MNNQEVNDNMGKVSRNNAPKYNVVTKLVHVIQKITKRSPKATTMKYINVVEGDVRNCIR